MAIGMRKRQRRAEPALLLCPLGDRSAQTKQRERTVSRYLDLAPRKRHVGFGECLDHCFFGREPGRQSVHPVAALAVVDFARRKNLAQVTVPERRQRVLDILDGNDIASDAYPAPVNLARQGDHALAVIVAVPRESTDADFEEAEARAAEGPGAGRISKSWSVSIKDQGSNWLGAGEICGADSGGRLLPHGITQPT